MINTKNALDMTRFPKEYRDYFTLEEGLVKKIASGKVLDIGCGKGRIIPALNSLCYSYTGIDKEKGLWGRARLNLKNIHFPIKFVACDANYLDDCFAEGEFDTSLCLWNTLPLIGNQEAALSKVAKVTKNNGKVLVTLVAKNDFSFRVRLDYYKSLGIECVPDEKTQTIYSDVWGESKAHEQSELEELSLATKVDLIEKGCLGPMGIYGIFSGGKK